MTTFVAYFCQNSSKFDQKLTITLFFIATPYVLELLFEYALIPTVFTLLIVRILIVVRPKSLLFEILIVHPLIVVQSLIVVTLYNFLN